MGRRTNAGRQTKGLTMANGLKVIIFGATGMVGQGALRECLADAGVEKVLAVVRSPTGKTHAKLEELIHKDFTDFSSVESKLAGYDACFFCLGISSAGMKEPDYRRVTYDFTLAAAKTLAKVSPAITFIYVSGEGTDSSEKGRSMWARVKGETENALLKLPFKAAFMFRPGIIKPGPGIVSKTGLYRALYVVATPLFPLVRALAPNMVTSTEQVGRAMVAVARDGAPTPVLATKEINARATAAS
jgi:uncharacterized protein YbjT (DUF2867 family)